MVGPSPFRKPFRMSLEPCNNARILIADDDAVILRLYGMMIKHAIPDIEAELASNGAEACEFFEQHHHAVAVTDLHMPVMDGLQAYHTIIERCRLLNWAPPSFIFCTGFTPPKALDGIFEAGSPHCLLKKPLSMDQVVEAIQERLAACRTLREAQIPTRC